MTEPIPPDDVADDRAAGPLHGAELRRARREFLIDAALEAERETGRRERTDEEARHSLWMRLARLIGGWVLLLVGLAAIPLPGPGWLMVLLGLSLLPYRWTENLIRQIRKRVPGIPEDGRIPTRTWVITGLVVALSTGASIWWGLRPEADGPARAQPAAAERSERGSGAGAAGTGTPDGPRLVVASTADPDRQQLSAIYGAVAAHLTSGRSEVTTTDDPCAALRRGDASLAVLPEGEVAACLGDPAGDPAALAGGLGLKLYRPVTVDGATFSVAVRTDAIALDDEPAELTLDGVSEAISGGAAVDGNPAGRAEELMRQAGVLE